MKTLLLITMIFTLQIAHADISLSELGMNSETPLETGKDKEFKAQMEERHSKLKTHEILGLSTWAAMTATMFTGGSALDSNLHMYLGMTTAALYFTTAYYSLTAPKPSSIKDKWRMKWHKGLAWVHFPLMIITPYLGYMYKRHEDRGQKHGPIEKQHSAFAGALYGSFTISAALMVIEF